MKYCKNCGESMEDMATSCSNCGDGSIEETAMDAGAETENISDADSNRTEPVAAGSPDGSAPSGEMASETKEVVNEMPAAAASSAPTSFSAPPSEPKKKSPALILGLIAVLVIGIGAFALKGMFTGGGPSNPFLQYHTKLFTDRFTPLAEAAISQDNKVSTDLTMTANVQGQGMEDIQSVLEDSSFVMKIDSGEDHILSNFEMNMKGSSLVSGIFHMDLKTMGFYLPEGDGNYYAGDTGKILNTLSDGEITDASELFGNVTKKDLEEYLQKWYQIVNASFTKENLIIEDKEITLDQLAETFKGKVYTFKPTNEDIQKSFVAFADMVEKDAKFRQMTSSMGASNYASMYGAMTPEMTEDDLLELAKEIKADPASFVGNFDPELLEWSIAVEKEAVRQLIFNYDSVGMVYEATAPVEKGSFSERFYVVGGMKAVDAANSNIELMVSNDYDKEGKSYTGSLQFEIPYQGTFVIDYAVDLAQKYILFPYGTYNLKIQEMPFVVLDIEVKDGENNSIDHVLDVKSTFGPSATININATQKGTAEKPNMTPVDISDYDKEQLETLIDQNMSTIGEGLDEVFRSLN